MRHSMGEQLTRENDTEDRWIEHFVQLLNGDEISEVRDVRSVRIGEKGREVRKVSREEIMGSAKEDKMW